MTNVRNNESTLEDNLYITDNIRLKKGQIEAVTSKIRNNDSHIFNDTTSFSNDVTNDTTYLSDTHLLLEIFFYTNPTHGILL